MGLFGTVSDMVAQTKDADLLDALDASSYKETTKTPLIATIRAADKELTRVKNAYGNGISVKGILANVSGFHFLKMVNLKAETGKSWSDSECRQPTNSVNPLVASYFFHAKSDGAMKGCRAGFTYNVLDKKSIIQGVISVAWENPYGAGSDFVYCAMVSKNQDQLQACLDHCDDSSTSKIAGDVTIKMDDGKLKQFITVNVKADNKSTAYILIGMKTDDIVREVFGEL